MSSTPLLSLDDVYASYGESKVLRGITMDIDTGETVSLIGRNGAGKTTTFRSIVGVLSPSRGQVRFNGEDISELKDYEKTRLGIRYVPEDRQLFPDLTVAENLRMGEIASTDGFFTTEQVFEEFPRLRERKSQSASTLSGGEQQMLVIARALVGTVELFLLDEPTEGLAPQIIEDVLEIIDRVKESGVTVLIAEQNINAALSVADRHYVIDKGQIVFEGTTDAIINSEDIQQRHLAVGVESETLFEE